MYAQERVLFKENFTTSWFLFSIWELPWLRPQKRPPEFNPSLTLELGGDYGVSSSRSAALFHTERRAGRSPAGLSLPCVKRSRIFSHRLGPCRGGEAAESVELGHCISPGRPGSLPTAPVRGPACRGGAPSSSPVVTPHSVQLPRGTPVSSD